jgi:hypothetical protein
VVNAVPAPPFWLIRTTLGPVLSVVVTVPTVCTLEPVVFPRSSSVPPPSVTAAVAGTIVVLFV